MVINPRTFERYHIEASVSTAFPLRFNETKDKNGKTRRNGLGYFATKKFNNPYVIEKIKLYFKEEPYTKILYVFDCDKEGQYAGTNFIPSEAQKNFGFIVKPISDIIERLKQFNAIKGSRDDVLRTLDLICRYEERTPNILKSRKELSDMLKAIEPNKKQRRIS